jgi:hypothetical protein
MCADAHTYTHTHVYTGGKSRVLTNYGHEFHIQKKKKRPYHHVSQNIQFMSYS